MVHHHVARPPPWLHPLRKFLLLRLGPIWVTAFLKLCRCLNPELLLAALEAPAHILNVTPNVLLAPAPPRRQ